MIPRREKGSKMDTKGKNAFVTGGNTGMGREIVMNLAEHGANIAFGYFDFEEEAEKLEKELQKYEGEGDK